MSAFQYQNTTTANPYWLAEINDDKTETSQKLTTKPHQPMKKLPETAIRNAKMIADYEKLPRESMSSIGRRYQVSREYARKVIHAHYANLKKDE